MSADRSPCFPLPRATDTLSATFHHPHATQQHNPPTVPQQPPHSPFRHSNYSQHAPPLTATPKSILPKRERANYKADGQQAGGAAPRGHKRRASFDSDADDSDSDHSSSDTAMKTAGSTSPTSPSFAFGRYGTMRGDHGHRHHRKADGEGSVKRTKTGKERQFSVSKLLATLDKPQLLTLVNSLIDSHPHLHPEILSHIPRPTIATVQPLLVTLERRLHDSFPYTKWGPTRDDYSFNRVKPVLTELVDTILDYTAHFTSSEEFPTTTFAYLHIATSVAHRLPQWDNRAHNGVKTELYEKLDSFWKRAVVEAADKCSEGKIYGQQVVGEWARNLVQHNAESNNALSAAVGEFQRRLGWIIGIAPPTNAVPQQQQQQQQQQQTGIAFAGGLFSDPAASRQHQYAQMHHHQQELLRQHQQMQQQAAGGQMRW
ncbi:Cut8 six-helix bundle-domain-containing protein [Jimgerdemannia flammicorona]|uniref:Tethering factor for nuclear proteasome STS1 n=1 Tax=Jimgerdemannia flammicorona TaxID=994334 RepID=A0A433QCG6_9FUNG|nr:Cut8 six-helix bundle-domain-containing protein [Jimgerdemannia flammicorona]